MRIEKEDIDGEIIICVIGRVDSITSIDLQNEIIGTFQDTNKVVLDFKDVLYISSAGIRALLLGHKTAISKSGYMKLRNVGESVMDVLVSTGFDDILTIEK
jgi:anti-anti-sigma factor